jgi:hypothetical protein
MYYYLIFFLSLEERRNLEKKSKIPLTSFWLGIDRLAAWSPESWSPCSSRISIGPPAIIHTWGLLLCHPGVLVFRHACRRSGSHIYNLI